MLPSNSPASLSKTPLEHNTVTRLAMAVLRALAAFHHAGYTHSDIKPSNIVVSPSGDFVVIDFGSAVPIGHEIRSFTQFYGLDLRNSN
jgi:serine/threonine protein kinase